jgi:hypothetical protein
MNWQALLDWTVWIIFAAGVLVVALGLFADRARSRRRCPRCWYDMQGIPGLTCPECGHAARHPRALKRTRRHWRWAAAGTLLLIAPYAADASRRIQNRGWIGAVPGLALVAAFPLVQEDDYNSLSLGQMKVFSELYVRLNEQAERRGPWIGVQRRVLAWMCVQHPTLHELNSPSCILLEQMMRRDILPRSALQRMCRSVLPTTVVCRSHWPRGVPLQLDFDVQRWPFSMLDQHALVFERGDDRHARGLRNPRVPFWLRRDPIPMGPGADPLWIDVKLIVEALPSPHSTAREQVLWRGRISIPTTLVPTVDEVMEPTALDDLPDALAFRIEISKEGPWISLIPDPHSALRLPGPRATFAARAVVLRNGLELAHAPLWGRADRRLQLFARFQGDLEALNSADFDSPEWQLLITCDPHAALRDFDSNRYWSGAFTVAPERITFILVR